MMAEVPDQYPEDIRKTFEYCDECESLVVSLDQHSCPKNGRKDRGHVNADERERLAQQDDRPADEQVLYPVMGRSNRNAWAYHELDETGDPLHEVEYLSKSDTAARETAQAAGCYPCGRCEAIQEHRDDQAEAESDE